MAEPNNGNHNGAIDKVVDEKIKEIFGISDGAEGVPNWDELGQISVPSKADYRLGPILFDTVFGETTDPPLAPPSPVALVSCESDGGSSSAGNSSGPIWSMTRSKQPYPSSVGQTSISETNSHAIKNETGGAETTEDDRSPLTMGSSQLTQQLKEWADKGVIAENPAQIQVETEPNQELAINKEAREEMMLPPSRRRTKPKWAKDYIM